METVETKKPLFTISRTARAEAKRLGLPDYFWEGRIALAIGSANDVTLQWQPFVNADVITSRLVVLHEERSNEPWVITDVLTGCRVCQAASKRAAWEQAHQRIGGAPVRTFETSVQVNSPAFHVAYRRLITMLSDADAVTRQGMLCACRDIISQVVRL